MPICPNSATIMRFSNRKVWMHSCVQCLSCQSWRILISKYCIQQYYFIVCEKKVKSKDESDGEIQRFMNHTVKEKSFFAFFFHGPARNVFKLCSQFLKSTYKSLVVIIF